AKGDLQRPAVSVGGQEEGGTGVDIRAKVGFIAAASTRVTDEGDAHRLLTQCLVPHGRLLEDLRRDLPAVEGQRQSMPLATSADPSGWSRQALTATARTTILAGLP